MSNSLPGSYHSLDTMSIPFAQIFKEHLIGEKDPYWRTIELKKALETKYSKDLWNKKCDLSFSLLLNLGHNLQFTKLSSERLPK